MSHTYSHFRTLKSRNRVQKTILRVKGGKGDESTSFLFLFLLDKKSTSFHFVIFEWNRIFFKFFIKKKKRKKNITRRRKIIHVMLQPKWARAFGSSGTKWVGTWTHTRVVLGSSFWLNISFTAKSKVISKQLSYYSFSVLRSIITKRYQVLISKVIFNWGFLIFKDDAGYVIRILFGYWFRLFD